MFSIFEHFKLIESILRIVVYSLMMVGLWFILSPLIKTSLSSRRLMLRQLRSDKNKININSFVYKHLERLLSITYNKRSNFAVLTLIVLMVSIFIFSLSFLIKSNQRFSYSIILSLLFSLSPYLFLLIRLNSIRVESSYEAVPLVTELSNNYKIHYLNMLEAIDITILRLNQLPYTKKAMVRMALRLKQYKNVEELDDIIQEFNYSINTQWSINLANSIYLAIAHKQNVTESFRDILEQLGELKKIRDKNKQLNNESFLIMKYFGPLFYLLSVFVLFNNIGFTTKKFIDYQFYNPNGIKSFTMVLASLIINYIIYLLVKKPKNDF